MTIYLFWKSRNELRDHKGQENIICSTVKYKMFYGHHSTLTPVALNQVKPYYIALQFRLRLLLKKPTDLDLHCLSLSM